VAEFYLKTGEKESAKVYYRQVVKRAGAGELHDKAKVRLAELGER
jgi:outer membrane protein assembly factor BamD (BamD/ComL family)